MKIAYVVSAPSGLPHFIYRELKQLEENGVKFSLNFTTNKPGLYEPDSSWEVYSFNFFLCILNNVKLFLSKPSLFISCLFESIIYRALFDFLLAGQFAEKMKSASRIHCHFGDHKLFVGYFASKLMRKKLSVTIHAYELYNNPNLSFFKKVIHYCDKIITISDFNRAKLIEVTGVAKKKIFVIRLFVDTEDYRPTDQIKILIVGRFIEKKGHIYLFRAIKKLPDTILWVVGSGKLDLRQLAKKLDIDDRVAFFGEQSGVALKSLYNQCDIFILPSVSSENGDREGIPVVLMEAMSFNKPVISTQHAGIPELVPSEMLIPEKNSVALINKIVELTAAKKIMTRKIIEESYSKRNIKKLIGCLK